MAMCVRVMMTYHLDDDDADLWAQLTRPVDLTIPSTEHALASIRHLLPVSKGVDE